MDLAGQYYRTEIDDQYDAFLSLLGQGWLVRKAAAVAPFSKKLVFESDTNDMEEHTSIAGLLNINSRFHVYDTREAADEARQAGKAVPEAAMGKECHLLAWFAPDNGGVVLHRVFPADAIEVFYHHRRESAEQMVLYLHARKLDGSSEVKSVEKFAVAQQ